MSKRIILSLTLLGLFASNAIQSMEKEASCAIGAHIPVYKMHLLWAKNELANNLHALHDECSKGNLEMVQLLIEAGADVNAKNGSGSTPLHWAGSANIAKVLIGAGADVNAKDDNGCTPLHHAADRWSVKIAKVLIEAGAKVNAQNNYGETPLHYTAQNGHVEIAQLLIDKGADVNAGNNAGSTPLHWAGSGNIAKVLIGAGADVNAQSKSGWTPLHKAALNGHVEIAQLLIDKGADVNAEINAGWTPLSVAAWEGFVEVAKLLIEAGADVYAQDTDGWTPLHKAAFRGHAEIAQLLLSGFTLAEPEIPTATFINKEGEVKIWDLKSLALMNALNTIEDFNVECFEDYPTLLNKCENILPFIDLHQDKIRQLLSSNEYTSKALADFCKHKHLEWLKKFIAMKNNKNETALDLARTNNKHDCLQMLEAAADVQSIDELPNDLKAMIEDNIKEMLLS